MLMLRIKQDLVFLRLFDLMNLLKFELLLQPEVKKINGVISGPASSALLVFFSGSNSKFH